MKLSALKRIGLGLLLLAGCLLGCSTTAQHEKDVKTAMNAAPTADSVAKNDSATNAISAADSPAKNDYKISPQDVVIVDVFNEKDLSNKEFRVSAKGEITYPMLGDVKIGGLTPAEASHRIKEMLDKDYLVNPQVTVTVKEYVARYVIVMGEVPKPGAIMLPGEQKWTILQAIGQAGGFTKGANKNKIEFTRNGKTKRYSVDELMKNAADPEKTLYVLPGDSINVPQTVF
jgi:protein involved in polysaccharide export with SLBB domain